MYHDKHLRALMRFYEHLETLLRPLQDLHGPRLQCRRGCHACCQDDIAIFGIEADYIRSHYVALLANGVPHPRGKCAFLDADGGCRIYTSRPFICRIYGLPLRWLERHGIKKNELRSICSLNEAGTPVDALPVQACVHAAPLEEALALLQFKASNGVLHKEMLRDLFGRDPSQ